MRDKVNQEPRNDKGEPHGKWIFYHDDGTLWFMGNKFNNQVYGYCIYQERGENGELTYVKEYYAR
jgi:hypothetical protein